MASPTTKLKPAPKAAPKAAAPAPAVSEPKPLAHVGQFAFVVDKGVTIPDIRPVERPQALPFKDIFDGMGHNDHMFIPRSYWTAPREDGGRGVPAEKATEPYAKTKVRDQFNGWKKLDEAREKCRLVIMARKKGDEIGARVFEEPGVSFWMLKD